MHPKKGAGGANTEEIAVTMLIAHTHKEKRK